MGTTNTPSFLKKSALSAIVFFGTTVILSMVYAAYQSINSSEYAPWAPMTSTLMGKIIGNIDNLNTRLTSAEGNGGITPAGAVMAFNLTTCPAGWSAADGTGGRLDLRGEFVRWLDNGRSVDTGRILWSTQVQSIQSHQHFMDNGWGPRGFNVTGPGGTGVGRTSEGAASGGFGYTDLTGDSETRPRNVALLYCIKN